MRETTKNNRYINQHKIAQLCNNQQQVTMQEQQLMYLPED